MDGWTRKLVIGNTSKVDLSVGQIFCESCNIPKDSRGMAVFTKLLQERILTSALLNSNTRSIYKFLCFDLVNINLCIYIFFIKISHKVQDLQLFSYFLLHFFASV